MSYRIKEKPRPKPKRTFEDATTPSKVFIQNGTTEYIAIPCWYVEVTPPYKAHCHSRQHHDHVGWPSPRHPDHICQAWDLAHSCCSFNRHKHHCDHCAHYLDMDRMVPIHLSNEGYTAIKPVLLNAPSGLTAEGYIDDRNDWIARIKFEARCESALSQKVNTEFAVFATGVFKGGKNVSDVIARGILEILPGPYV